MQTDMIETKKEESRERDQVVHARELFFFPTLSLLLLLNYNYYYYYYFL